MRNVRTSTPYSSIGSPTAIISFFFFNDTATTEIYTLSLHDALPIFKTISRVVRSGCETEERVSPFRRVGVGDRKSTRLNSSHGYISYAVFCLKKKRLHRCHIVRYTLLVDHTTTL